MSFVASDYFFLSKIAYDYLSFERCFLSFSLNFSVPPNIGSTRIPLPHRTFNGVVGFYYFRSFESSGILWIEDFT